MPIYLFVIAKVEREKTYDKYTNLLSDFLSISQTRFPNVFRRVCELLFCTLIRYWVKVSLKIAFRCCIVNFSPLLFLNWYSCGLNLPCSPSSALKWAKASLRFWLMIRQRFFLIFLSTIIKSSFPSRSFHLSDSKS